jgi:hypothetical protein
VVAVIIHMLVATHHCYTMIFECADGVVVEYSGITSQPTRRLSFMLEKLPRCLRELGVQAGAVQFATMSEKLPKELALVNEALTTSTSLAAGLRARGGPFLGSPTHREIDIAAALANIDKEHFDLTNKAKACIASAASVPCAAKLRAHLGDAQYMLQPLFSNTRAVKASGAKRRLKHAKYSTGWRKAKWGTAFRAARKLCDAKQWSSGKKKAWRDQRQRPCVAEPSRELLALCDGAVGGNMVPCADDAIYVEPEYPNNDPNYIGSSGEEGSAGYATAISHSTSDLAHSLFATVRANMQEALANRDAVHAWALQFKEDMARQHPEPQEELQDEGGEAAADP